MQVWCPTCQNELKTKHEKERDSCFDCLEEDRKFRCAECEKKLLMIEPNKLNFCSDQCQDRFYDLLSQI